MCRIRIDEYETSSGVPEALCRTGALIDLKRLPAGDYEVAPGVPVERKTVVDLHWSVERGRLWRQIGDLRRTARLPYLLGTSRFSRRCFRLYRQSR